MLTSSEAERIAQINAERSACRGFLIFATDPSIPDAPDYRRVYMTQARTPAKAAAKIRPLSDKRRLHVYLATGQYRDEIANAQWVA